MSISKINFTAESNYLSQMYNKTSEKSQSAVASVTAPETKTEPETLQTNTQSKNHKVRNWSIGLGSAAVLIGLGVLGRRGNLGKGIQKFLGGAEKKVSNLEEGLEQTSRKTNNELGEAAQRTESKVENTSSSAVEDKPSRAINDESPESANLNAGINDLFEGIPRKIEVPDPTPIIKDIEQIDISKIKDNFGIIKLPNGNTRKIRLLNNKLWYIIDKNSNGEEVLQVNYLAGGIDSIRQKDIIFDCLNGELLWIKKVKGDLLYEYSLDGNLKGVFRTNSNDEREWIPLNKY